MTDLLRTFRPLASDFLSTIFFIVAYEVTGDIIAATLTGIGVSILQFLWFRYRKHDIALMQWASLFLVLVLGTATLLTRDPRFVMIKPSIAGTAIAVVMLQNGWQLRYMPQIVKENASRAFLVGWGYIWSALYFMLAAANLYIALKLGTKDWVAFNATVTWMAPVGLFLIQYATMRYVVRRNIMVRMSQAAPAE
ncbi:MAG TPA: septation protein IspZ [Rhizomicrobium sp.]|nr:septation protein IspZ [Rhizomicrobium sp.]